MKQTVLAIIILLSLTGCETNKETVEAFNKGLQLKCGSGPFSYGEVISNENWKYSENLETFYNTSGDMYNADRCVSR